MGTKIYLTPPGGQEQEQEVKVYKQCRVTLSATNRAGSFVLELPGVTNELVDAFPVGTDARVEQDENIFRGWVLNPAKQLDGRVKLVSISGADYTAKTQKIVITESYTDKEIGDIVLDLFAKRVPWADTLKVESCTQVISKRFADVFLWDAMDLLCKLSGYEWFIDEDLVVNFFLPTSKINENILREGTFHKGSANISPDSSKLVNRLLVKGGKALSNLYPQAITVDGTTPIPLHYTPRAPDGESVTVVIGGVTKTVGIENISLPGTKDFLLNANEKMLIPDLCTSGSGTITYRYAYPIKMLLEDPVSQTKYGLFEDILNVETDDRDLVRELGLRHLSKYSDPVVTGSIRPFSGTYKPGELVKIEIPSLNVDEYLQVKVAAYESVAGVGRVERSLSLESLDRDVNNILKDLNQRLMKIEKSVYQDDEGPVEKLVLAYAQLPMPKLNSSVTHNLHQYHVCSEALLCSEELII